MEIPCPTRSHSIQDKLEIFIYLSWDKFKKVNVNLYFIFDNYYTCCVENSVDLDQLASVQLIWIYTIFFNPVGDFGIA